MDNELKILHQFIWRPCISMHTLWWQQLDVELWQDKYRFGTLLAERIDALVVSRYGLVSNDRVTGTMATSNSVTTRTSCRNLTDNNPANEDKVSDTACNKITSFTLSGDEKALLRLHGRLRAIITVLGLFYLNCPDYLLLRLYREALGDMLTEEQLDQAWALWPQRPHYPVRLLMATTPEIIPGQVAQISNGQLSDDQLSDRQRTDEQLSEVPIIDGQLSVLQKIALQGEVLCAAEELAELAETAALTVLEQQYRHSIVWQAMRMMLPPLSAALSLPAGEREVSCGRWLFRLGSLL